MTHAAILMLLFLGVPLMAGAAPAEDMTDCIAGWKAEESGQHMRSAELTSRCIANGNLTEATAARAWRNLGIALRAAGHAQKAVEAFNIAISMKPADAWKDLINLGNAYSDLNDYESALKAYDKAQQTASNPGEIHYNRGLVYEAMGRVDEAKAEYLRAFNSGLRTERLGARVIALGLFEQVQELW